MKLKVKQDAKLLDYLYNNLPMPKKKIKSLLTHGNIYINNSCITKYDYPLYEGMEVFINTNDNKQLSLEILYEDDNIIVVNKPSGLLTIATANEKEKTLYHYVSKYLKSKKKNQKVFIVHRLDKDTSGIVLLAKNLKIKQELQQNWNELVKVREYCAVVFGKMKQKEATLVNKLMETKTNFVYVSNSNQAKEAITSYKVVKQNSLYSLLTINILTGRKNQIRVQLANIGNPVVGDTKYGNNDKKFSRLYLHANKLVLFYPILKKEMSFTASIPKEFSKII